MPLCSTGRTPKIHLDCHPGVPGGSYELPACEIVGTDFADGGLFYTDRRPGYVQRHESKLYALFLSSRCHSDQGLVAAIPLGMLDEFLGYPCAFTPGKHPNHEAIAVHIVLARTSLSLAVGIATIIKRYRKQNHNLIRVIKREGGIYYMSLLILRFFASLAATPEHFIRDDYEVLYTLRVLFTFTFADRLLLQMRKVDDPGTRRAISTLIFNPKTPVGQESIDAETGEPTAHTSNEGQGSNSEKKRFSEGISFYTIACSAHYARNLREALEEAGYCIAGRNSETRFARPASATPGLSSPGLPTPGDTRYGPVSISQAWSMH
ncbi:hypothetical protein NMY22_g3507 [Coprinellus aureogranulatus]|nr:hypothetical protein NMY22_g3507 [Coprinellus aureogranulatus]